MKIAICDDEIQFKKDICFLLEKWARERNRELHIYQFDNGDDLLSAQQKECMDLIILDVVMPLVNGIDVARELRSLNQMVPIIFLTSSKEFAVESYEVKAFYYLMKPVMEKKFFSVLDDFVKKMEKPKDFFMARTICGFCKIYVSEVEYLEAQNKQVLIYLIDGKVLEVKELFSKCEEVFSIDKGFFKCHRSYIVNMNRVEQFTKVQVFISNGAVVPISRNRYAAFKEVYFDYMFQ